MYKKYTDIFFNIILVVIVVTLGWFLLFPITMHLMIFADFFADADPSLVQLDFIPKALRMAAISTFLSFGFFFVKDRFRYFFLILPLATPSIFALIYATNV